MTYLDDGRDFQSKRPMVVYGDSIYLKFFRLQKKRLHVIHPQ
nr:MAG TPA: hypothetical protein [Caudoviricetes sp.]